MAFRNEKKSDDSTPNLTEVKLELREMGLLTEENEKLLSELNEDDARNLSSTISCLTRGKLILTQEMLRLCISHIKHYHFSCINWSMMALEKEHLVNPENVLRLTQNLPYAGKLGTAVSWLSGDRYDANTLTQSDFVVLTQNAPHADKLAKAMSSLRKRGCSTSEVEACLAQHAENALGLADAIAHLMSVKLWNPDNKKLLFDQAPHADGIYSALLKFSSSELDQNIFLRLIQHAPQADGFASAASRLCEVRLADSKNCASLLEYIEHASYFASIMVILRDKVIVRDMVTFRDKTLLTQPNFDKLIDYREYGEQILAALKSARVVDQAVFDDIIDKLSRVAYAMGFHKRLGEKSALKEYSLLGGSGATGPLSKLVFEFASLRR